MVIQKEEKRKKVKEERQRSEEERANVLSPIIHTQKIGNKIACPIFILYFIQKQK